MGIMRKQKKRLTLKKFALIGFQFRSRFLLLSIFVPQHVYLYFSNILFSVNFTFIKNCIISTGARANEKIIQILLIQEDVIRKQLAISTCVCSTTFYFYFITLGTIIFLANIENLQLILLKLFSCSCAESINE